METPEIPQPDQLETTIPAPAKKAKTWHLPAIDWVKLNEKSGLFGSLFLKTAGLVLLISFFFILRKEFLKKDYVIENFQVPKALDENGMNGVVLANHLLDKMNEIKATAKIHKETQTYLQSTNRTDVKMEVLGVGFSIESVIRFLKESFGVSVKSISGDLIKADSTLELTVRMSGNEARVFRQSFKNSFSETLNPLIQQASEYILLQNDPILLAFYRIHQNSAYFFNEQEHYEACIEASQMALQKFPADSKWAYSTWSLALSGLERYVEALEKAALAMQIDSSLAVGRDAYGVALSTAGKHEEAKKQFQKAVELDSTYHPAWANWGNELFMESRLWESSEKYEKAFQLDRQNMMYAVSLGKSLVSSERPEESLKKFRKLSELKSQRETPMFDFFWGVAAQHFGDTATANEKLQKAYQRDSTDFNVHYSFALKYLAQGQYQRASQEIPKIEASAKKFGYKSSWQVDNVKMYLYASAKNPEKCFEVMEKVLLSEKTVGRNTLELWRDEKSPFFDNVRQEKRFQQIMQLSKMYWRKWYYREK